MTATNRNKVNTWHNEKEMTNRDEPAVRKDNAGERVHGHGQAAAELAHDLDDYTIAPLQAKGNPAASAPARANLPGADAEVQGASPEITLQVCMRLLQGPAHSLQERPPHITEEVNPYMLFMESPKQKRTAGKWSGLQGGRIDRWANSGGVSGAHDYFPSAKPEACVGVRKR